jgi:hypothetical protein
LDRKHRVWYFVRENEPDVVRAIDLSRPFAVIQVYRARWGRLAMSALAVGPHGELYIAQEGCVRRVITPFTDPDFAIGMGGGLSSANQATK